jgi:hypothetical protein
VACRYGSPLVHGRFGPWMYEPHEAREDTVVFPALRDVVPDFVGTSPVAADLSPMWSVRPALLLCSMREQIYLLSATPN